jgi:hypothetical protein
MEGSTGSENNLKEHKHVAGWLPPWAKNRRVYTIKKWFVKYNSEDPYLAPERKMIMVGGEIYDHPNFEDGSVITTSTIKDVHQRYVLTYTGTVYKLFGRPRKEYMQFLKDNGITYDGYQPIKVKR